MANTAFSPIDDNSTLPLEEQIGQLKEQIGLQKETVHTLSAEGHEFVDAEKQLGLMYERLTALLKARRTKAQHAGPYNPDSGPA